MYLKIIFTGIYLYYSIVKTLKFKDDEGVVGIMSSLLLIVITLFY
ncbi:putative membrane protein [Clostridioides difficile CD149]|nr:putative membrane protein [Clostridioides difficile CD8]EQE42204.1 putative membrane protein [Clostridioides difficile CD40]EQE55070.1 putative membrane protein [Clostridioides difficile CD43]EQF19721.1 putative membrane protein [Clostridioides difficile CD149]EQF28562.1 putative membrane protein [Clostridioides difficile CD159]EQF32966.1 putative membrane protein [Clostridioides difficile CD165]EQF53597.1 putative membrane protein [Clostridioides difficile CD178]EQF62145.1 putative membr